MLFAAVLYVLLRDYTTECLWLMISKNMDYLPALLVDQGLISALFPTDLSDSTLSYTETEAASSPNITPGEFSGTCFCFTYSGQMSSFDMFFFFFNQFPKLISRVKMHEVPVCKYWCDVKYGCWLWVVRSCLDVCAYMDLGCDFSYISFLTYFLIYVWTAVWSSGTSALTSTYYSDWF